MKYKHTIYLPKHDNDDMPGSYHIADNIRKEIIGAMTRNFGGCSIVDVNGYWMNDRGIVMRDKVWAIYTITDAKTIEGMIAFYISLIKDSLHQETVMYTIEEVSDVIFL